jgi:hypothetical protein
MTVNVLYRLSKHSDRGVYVSGEKPSRPPAAHRFGFSDQPLTRLDEHHDPAKGRASNVEDQQR